MCVRHGAKPHVAHTQKKISYVVGTTVHDLKSHHAKNLAQCISQRGRKMVKFSRVRFFSKCRIFCYGNPNFKGCHPPISGKTSGLTFFNNLPSISNSKFYKNPPIQKGAHSPPPLAVVSLHTEPKLTKSKVVRFWFRFQVFWIKSHEQIT